MRNQFIKTIALAVPLAFAGFAAVAGSYSYDFNSDPATDPDFSIRGNAVWRATGSFDGSGYISLTDAVGGQQGSIVLPDKDGSELVSFVLKAKVRLGGGSGRPADGMSISFADATDGIVTSGSVGEDGTATGLSINLDTWDNGFGDGPALDIKLNGNTIAHKRFAGSGAGTTTSGIDCAPIETDGAGNPISLETDPANTPNPGTFVDIEISMNAAGAVSVKYKGLDIYKDVPTGYKPIAGRWVFGGRTGGAWDNNWVDNLTIDTQTKSELDIRPTILGATGVGNPARDLNEHSPISLTIDYSSSIFALSPGSIHVALDGSDVTADPNTTIVDDSGTRMATVSYAPATQWDAASRHELAVTFTDDDSVTPVTSTGRQVIFVTPVVAQTAQGTTLFIEAEDFNYSDDGVIGGLHANFGDADCSLLGKNAVLDVDYHEVNNGNDQAIYRAPTGVEAGKLNEGGESDRAGTTISCNYIVGWNDPGDWMNYTRDFPNTTYKVYGRFASGGADTHVSLSKVTSDPAAAGQTTTPLGNFDADATGNWDSFCFVPLRDPSGADVIVRLNGLTTLRLTTVAGNDDVDYLAFVPTFSPTLRPNVVSVTPPNNSQSGLRDVIVKAIIGDRDTAVVASSIHLSIDGAEVAATVTDTADGAEVQFQAVPGFTPGSTHTAAVTFADNDATPVSQTVSWSFTAGYFKSGASTLYIEAEDFNYSDDGIVGGLHGNFGDPDCSLFGKNAVPDIDYHEVNNGNDQAIYRAPTGVEAGKLNEGGESERGDHTVSCNYIVGWNDAGDWYNYTRDFGATARYNVYARLASGGADEHAALDFVTSDPTAGSQTTARIGTFDSAATGNWDSFHTVPLRDTQGNLVNVRIGGLTTVRFTTLPGNLDVNYLAFVKADVQFITPTVQSVEPRASSDYARAPLITAIIADQDSKVVASSLKLTFDGANVTASSTIVDTAGGAQIAYQAPGGSPVGTVHNVKVDWSDDQATPVAGSFSWTYKEGIYNADKNLFIEMEDFNSDFGTYIPSTPGHAFNEKGQYAGLTAIPDVDFHDTTGDSHAYREANLLSGMATLDDSYRTGAGARPGFETVSDFKIGWGDGGPGGAGGDWYNYTRNYGSGAAFSVYLRCSHGTAGATMGGRLELVDDPGSQSQVTTFLGRFRAPATAGWDTFAFVPMMAPDGRLASVILSGEKTLRFTTEADGPDINYLMLCPQPFVQVSRNGNNLTVTWPFGALQVADDINGPWQTVPGATSPLVVPIDSTILKRFARIISQ